MAVMIRKPASLIPVNRDSRDRPILHAVLVALVFLAGISVANPARAQDGNAVFSAINRGDVARVKALVQKDPALLRQAGQTRMTGYEHVMAGGTTPLTFAVQEGKFGIVELLLKLKADPNLPDPGRKRTALHYCDGTKLAFADLLYKYKANVNAPGSGGITCLHTAANVEDIAFARWLLAHKANPNVRAADGDTPLLYLMRWAHMNKAIAMLLKEHGADLRATDRRGYTAAELAQMAGNPVLAQALRP